MALWVKALVQQACLPDLASHREGREPSPEPASGSCMLMPTLPLDRMHTSAITAIEKIKELQRCSKQLSVMKAKNQELK